MCGLSSSSSSLSLASSLFEGILPCADTFDFLLALREGTPESGKSCSSEPETALLSSMLWMAFCKCPRLMEFASRCSTEERLRSLKRSCETMRPSFNEDAFPVTPFRWSSRSCVEASTALWERRAVLPVLGRSRSSSCLLKVRCMSSALRSFVSSPKGFSSSVAMEFKLQKKATCTKVSKPVQTGEPVHMHMRKGLSNQCEVSSSSVACTYGKGRGILTIFKAWR
mmetsp:Transcript_93158/g.290432  ORF Transcript_93158/g.290432 Transcript_93158/m.290432 type:complete len:225 (+) Transcript_93158:693-1367(+)